MCNLELHDQSLGGRLRTDDAHRGAVDLGHTEGLHLELEFTRLNLRDVENVVHQVEQVLARHVRILHVLAHLLRQLVGHGELKHPQHAIERRSHLMRHGREKIALGVVRGAHLGRVDLRLLHVLLLGDILADADDTDYRPLGVTARRGVQQQLDAPAVFRVDRELQIPTIHSLERAREHIAD